MLRLSSQTHRLLLVAMAFLFALTLSLFGIRAALAAHYVSLNTRAGFETAVRLEPMIPKCGILSAATGNTTQSREIQAGHKNVWDFTGPEPSFSRYLAGLGFGI